MKTKERTQARELRKQGMSIKTIARHLSVSSSSVSLWVRDIPLTEKQRNFLMCGSEAGRKKATQMHSLKCKNQRRKWQQDGRLLAHQNKLNPLFVMGCSLYWAEGSKGKNTVVFSNSDPNMIQVFVRFLTNYCHTKPENLRFSVNVYLDNENDILLVQQYWEKIINLSEVNWIKCFINCKPTSSSGLKKGKLPNGTLTVKINSTQIVQQIFGAIQELGGFESEKWID